MTDVPPASRQSRRAFKPHREIRQRLRQHAGRLSRALYFLTVARRFLREEPNHREGLRLAIAAVMVSLRRGGRPLGRPLVVRPTASGDRGVELRVWSFIDLLVVREIFLEAEYRLPAGTKPRAILDLGANIGVSALFFRAVYPDAVVLAVEPDPAQFARLERNAAGDPMIRPIAGAATVASGPVTFYQAAQGWLSGLERPAQISATEITVPGLSIPEILARGGVDRVDLVKLDIEGGEWALLEDGALQAATDLVVGELHRGSPERARALLDGWSFTTHRVEGELATFTARR